MVGSESSPGNYKAFQISIWGNNKKYRNAKIRS